MIQLIVVELTALLSYALTLTLLELFSYFDA
jgi:hypothetical protein